MDPDYYLSNMLQGENISDLYGDESLENILTINRKNWKSPNFEIWRPTFDKFAKHLENFYFEMMKSQRAHPPHPFIYEYCLTSIYCLQTMIVFYTAHGCDPGIDQLERQSPDTS